MCHSEYAQCLVDSRATPSLSLLQGRNESTRVDPRPAVAGSAPSRTAMRNKGAAGGMASAGPGSYTRTRWPAGPLRGSARTAGPAPAPPRPSKELGNGHPPPPTARAHAPELTPDTRRARGRSPATRAVRGPWTATPGLAREMKGLIPPARRGSRCGRGAYPAVPPLSLLEALRSSSRCRRPNGLGCLRPGWRADPRTRRSCPPRRLRAPAPRPAPGMRTGRLGFGTGRGGAGGELGPREGGTPSRRPLGSWVSRPPRPGSHFRLGDRGAERLPSCCALVEGRRTVSDLT